MLSFFLKCVPARIQLASLRLKVMMDANDALPGFRIRGHQLVCAAGYFLVKFRHNGILLSLPVGRFARLGGTIATAAA